ncbi:MAG TPA: membrane protein insertion efficiency factor YidD [Candidatus Omnitrophota bacterium]|nr:membrane protein insertion efficiency factor YidD [Candidatus Omnitrophota bacterium]HPN55271.1 membrane protein insertion efficiency factor YidD [Candidatus Omnitrophota bacterium]
MIRLLSVLIKSYQKVSRIFFPSTCRYYPSCSNYALEAIRRHGFFRGMVLSVWRIMRCTPFSKGGYDPVR